MIIIPYSTAGWAINFSKGGTWTNSESSLQCDGRGHFQWVFFFSHISPTSTLKRTLHQKTVYGFLRCCGIWHDVMTAAYLGVQLKKSWLCRLGSKAPTSSPGPHQTNDVPCSASDQLTKWKVFLNHVCARLAGKVQSYPSSQRWAHLPRFLPAAGRSWRAP